MNAIVIYPKNATFSVLVPEDQCDNHRSILAWVWDAAQNGIEEIKGCPSETDVLNKGYGARLRSSMVGDIYIVEGSYYMVDNNGFVALTPAQFFQVQRADDVDRLMGWKWMHQHGIVTGESTRVE